MIRLSPETSERLQSQLTKAPMQRELEVALIEDGSVDADRLRAMGICDGRRIELLRSGDPLIVRAAGTRIGISRRLAERVQVLHS